MTFLWRDALWLLPALPMLIGAYIVLSRRRNRHALPYTAISLVREAVRTQWVRRHIPPLLFLVAIAALVLAVARPAAVVELPSGQGTVILAIDVSLSMAATDVTPTRLAAARTAAMGFINGQPRGVRIGIVAFGAQADIVQSPTLNRQEAMAALERLELQPHTGIGTGLIAALLTIHPDANPGDEYDIFGRGRRPSGVHTTTMDVAHAEGKPHKRIVPGSDLSTAIVLVSDGRGTIGVPPARAAKMAADRGVRVYTVGIGTPYGGTVNVEGWPTIHADFDEEILREIADITRGEYFHAGTADKVKKVYDRLATRVVLVRKESEITVLFTVIGAVLSLTAAVLSLLWCHRLP